MDDVTMDWNPLGDVYYRKLEVYDMFWKDRIELSQFRATAGQFGGPVALVKEAGGGSVGVGGRPTIYIFTSSGQEQGAFKWEGGKLVCMGWSNREDLVCIAEDGNVHIYDMFGTYIRQFTMGVEVQRATVIEAEIFYSKYGTGLCVLTGDYQFFVINNIDDIKAKRMQNPINMDAPPSSWAVLCPQEDEGAKVLMSNEGVVYELDAFQPKTKNIVVSQAYKTFIDIRVSFNQKHVAMFADTGLMWIGPSNLNDVYCEFNTHLQKKPTQLTWCGSGAVVGYWDNYLMMVGPKKDTIKYFVEGKVHLVQETDGVRIIGNTKQEFLHKVPNEVEDVFKIGSMKPGAVLLDAYREYERKSARVDDNMRTIKDYLQEAVQECVLAAGHELDHTKQRILIKAAAFGKSFIQDMRPQAFVEMCQTIRVLNNIREYHISIPLTLDQFRRLELPLLIDRLMMRRLYPLAIHISNYMKLPKKDGESVILAHWACYKVQQDNDDEQCAKCISDKLGNTSGISYTEIASKALDKGRTALAIKLLDYETRADNQVPLLLRMNRGELALQKAVESGDAELVYLVTEHMKKNLTLAEFLLKVRQHPQALSLIIKSSKHDDRQMLIDIYYQEDQFSHSANAYIEDSLAEKVLEARIKCLSKAKESLDKALLIPGASPGDKAMHQFGSNMTEENIRLLEYQSKLQENFSKTFLNLSVSDTLYQLLYQGHHSQAEQLRKDFNIPDVRYWWMKIQALSASKDWVELERFSKVKKSPIGYEPFVEACWKFGATAEVDKYILKVLPESRIRLYMKMGDFEEAAETAFQLKSSEDLDMIASKCSANRSAMEKINVLRAQLKR